MGDERLLVLSIFPAPWSWKFKANKDKKRRPAPLGSW